MSAALQTGAEVSIFAGMVRKLETSGNENGNEMIFRVKRCAFVGKFENLRKRECRGFEETSRCFLTV